jgi:hypothetical protein
MANIRSEREQGVEIVGRNADKGRKPSSSELNKISAKKLVTK